MLNALTILVLCQFVGELVARGAGLPIPGPVIGMLLLLVGLAVRERWFRKPPSEELRKTGFGLLSHLSLLFVPAGVGVITQLDVLGHNLLPIAVAVVVSTAAGLLVTGVVMQRLSRGE